MNRTEPVSSSSVSSILNASDSAYAVKVTDNRKHREGKHCARRTWGTSKNILQRRDQNDKLESKRQTRSTEAWFLREQRARFGAYSAEGRRQKASQQMRLIRTG